MEGLHYTGILPLTAMLIAVVGLILALRGSSKAQFLWTTMVFLLVFNWPLYLFSFITLDYTLAEVAKNASDDLGILLRIGAGWSGGGSSLYLLTVIFATSLHIVMKGGKDNNRILVVGNTLVIQFLATCWLNGAFEEVEDVGGFGMNPLLKSPWVLPHPLTTFGGYAMIAAGSLGILLHRKDRVQPILLLGWSLLTLGIVFGGMWSYETFGWGGYWAWDPVEISELTVWLAATMILHMMGPLSSFRIPASSLVISSVFLALYITRSGLSPLHSFASPNLSAVFLLAGSVYFLVLFIIMTSQSVSIRDFSMGVRKAWSERNVGLLSLVLGVLALSIMSFFLFSSLFIPAILSALGVNVSIPTMVEGTRFYHRVLYPLALVLVASLPGYFVARLAGAQVYLSLLLVGLTLSTIGFIAVLNGVVEYAPMDDVSTNMKIAFALPLSIVMLAAMLLSIVYSIYMAVSTRTHAQTLSAIVVDSLRATIHLGVVITFLGIVVSGPFSFNSSYEKVYELRLGEKIKAGEIEIELVSYEYKPGRGVIDLYSHVAGSTMSSITAWNALHVLLTDLGPLISELDAVTRNATLASQVQAIISLVKASKMGPKLLEVRGNATIHALEPAVHSSNNSATALIELVLSEPSIYYKMMNQQQQEPGGTITTFHPVIESSRLTLVVDSKPVENTLKNHGMLHLKFEPPAPLNLSDETIILIEEARLVYNYSSTDRQPVMVGETGASSGNLGFLEVVKGTILWRETGLSIPLNLPPAVIMYAMTLLEEESFLNNLLSSPVKELLSNHTLIIEAMGPSPLELRLPKIALNGVELYLKLRVSHIEKGFSEDVTAHLRFEANGEAVGIHGLVTDVILLRTGASDIYIHVRPPIVQGFVNAYHELLVYYLKESREILSPQEYISLASTLAAGYLFGGSPRASSMEAAYQVEQALADLLLLSSTFDTGNNSIVTEGLLVSVKVVKGVNLVWTGSFIMAASSIILSLIMLTKPSHGKGRFRYNQYSG